MHNGNCQFTDLKYRGTFWKSIIIGILCTGCSLSFANMTITHNRKTIIKDGFESSGQKTAPDDADPKGKLWFVTEGAPTFVQVVEGGDIKPAEGKRYLRLEGNNTSRAGIIFKKPVTQGTLVWEFSAYLDKKHTNAALFTMLPADGKGDCPVYYAVVALTTPTPGSGYVNYRTYNESIPLDSKKHGGKVKYKAGKWQTWRIEVDVQEKGYDRFRVSVDGKESDWLPVKEEGGIRGVRFCPGAKNRRLLIDGKSSSLTRRGH